jgi:hypothetical protein
MEAAVRPTRRPEAMRRRRTTRGKPTPLPPRTVHPPSARSGVTAAPTPPAAAEHATQVCAYAPSLRATARQGASVAAGSAPADFAPAAMASTKGARSRPIAAGDRARITSVRASRRAIHARPSRRRPARSAARVGATSAMEVCRSACPAAPRVTHAPLPRGAARVFHVSWDRASPTAERPSASPQSAASANVPRTARAVIAREACALATTTTSVRSRSAYWHPIAARARPARTEGVSARTNALGCSGGSVQR